MERYDGGLRIGSGLTRRDLLAFAAVGLMAGGARSSSAADDVSRTRISDEPIAPEYGRCVAGSGREPTCSTGRSN